MDKNIKTSLSNPSNNYIQPVLIVLIVIAAFFIGSLWTKVQLLERGSGLANVKGTSDTAGQGAGTQGQPPSKYKSFEDAMKALAKNVKLDGNKLVSCMNSGSKKPLVDADASQGTGVGVNGTPAFYVNGKFISGAQDFSVFKEVIDKELAGTASVDLKDYSQTLQSMASQGAFQPNPKSIETGNALSRGNANAKVTLVEFSDFQCPFCSRAEPTVERIMKEYDGKVRLVYKHFPLLQLHPRAQIAAEASECAKDQGKFWEFHDQLFATQSDWSSL